MSPRLAPRCAAWSVALLSALCWAAPALSEDAVIPLGHRTGLRSEVLGEERPLLIRLPRSYEASPTARYPVLYLLDGDRHFHHVTGIVELLAATGRMPEMIVVAVPNTRDRTHDLTPPVDEAARDPDGRVLSKAHPTAGGADRFLRFLTGELVPHVDARYRTRPYRVLVGHSFAGLFTVHTLVHEPESFHGYVAISPSLYWNNRELVRRAPDALARLAVPGRGLHLTVGAEGERMRGPARELAQALRKRKPAALTWYYSELSDEDHGGTPLRGAYDGLVFLFSGWRPPHTLLDSGELAGLEAHYAGLTRRMGYPVLPPEALLHHVGNNHLLAKRIPQALAVFERNAILYPDSLHAHDSLGKALEASGRLQEALERYERVLALGREREDPEVPTYQQRVEGLRARLTPRPVP